MRNVDASACGRVEDARIREKRNVERRVLYANNREASAMID